jgi:hypothetical protein
MAFTPTTKKVAAATPAKKAVGGRPVFNLKVKPQGEKDLADVTGLWESTSKAGNSYLSGKGKESEYRFMVFDSKKVQGAKELSCKKVGSEGKMDKLCVLTAKEGKSGETYFVGEHDGNQYYLFPVKAKEA